MKWLIRLYKLYMKGAKENDFPFSKYGMFGEGLNRKEKKDE